jgi:DNA-binding SARP family transcriptional activator
VPAVPHRPSGLHRHRLLDELSALRSTPLALVVAPAGSGKTTLLAQYASGWPGPVGWLAVEPTDAAVPTLLGRLWRALLPGDQRQSPTHLDDLVRRLPVGPDRLLVLDDLHYLIGSESEGLFESLVNRVPAGLRVLAAGRRMPDVNLYRYELSNAVLIDAERLRFRTWEVEHLLRDVYREPLPPDDVAMLARRVGGWAAGLQMFHLSTSGRPLAERRRAVAALDGRSPLTRGYLARTVLAELPGALREFLVRTCVFDVLTAERCDRLLGDHASQAHLAELERRQAFTASGDNGVTFRYHEVLRAHLAVRLAETLGEAGARAWHRRAAELLEREHADAEAVRAYARAEDWEAVRRLVHQIGAVLADEGYEPWRELLPGWLVAGDPWLILAEGRHRFRRGQLRAAVDCFRRAEAIFGEEASARCREARWQVSAWLPGRTSAPRPVSGLLREATRRHPALVAMAQIDPAEPARPLVQAGAWLLAGNVTEARAVLSRVDTDDTTPTGLCLRLLAAVLHDREYARIILDAERAQVPWLVRMARAAGALSGTELAVKEAYAVAEECHRDDDVWGEVLATAAACCARIAAGTIEVDELAGLVRRTRELDAGVLEAWAYAMYALAAARDGLPDAEPEARRAEQLARSAGVPGARAAALVAIAPTLLDEACAVAAECGFPEGLVRRWSSQPAAAGAPASLTIRCLGGFEMLIAGQKLDLSAIKPRTRSALRLLALHAGGPVHRESLLAALWPEMPAATATHNLHVALSSLRSFLEPGVPRGQATILVRRGDAYELTLPPGAYCDVVAFRESVAAVRRARLAGAESALRTALRATVDAYGGELLPEDGPAEWVVRDRESMRREAADAAALLADTELAAGNPDAARRTAERCIGIDRYCDGGWRALADAYQRLGDAAAAERARQDYTRVLSSLGLDPAAALPAR